MDLKMFTQWAQKAIQESQILAMKMGNQAISVKPQIATRSEE